ncbi:DNA mismatch repair protein [Halorubellus sp. JP-L1]|uniref:MutS-related protein n=1 Tax=Halorubellus sp. JP-L1 TaxID=2715753 RepID=UPI001408E2B7|nr:DNA mismatch repair protein [Halorubellus sp. JP-L1]NHN41980.1 DNA mismatch repair protein [Halorubellus sp. JP-L1]
MRLEEYWGVGPKTRALLVEELGVDAAIDAIESADVRALVDAGVPRGRATRILRRATGGAGMDVLATSDAREVYKEILSIAGSFALTDGAADAIHVLTPLSDVDAMGERLADVEAARASWEALSSEERSAVEAAFATYDDAGGGEKAAVEAAVALLDAGVVREDGVFAPLADLDREALADAARALGALREGRVAPGADDRLDALREHVADVETLEANAASVVEEIREGSAPTAGGFQDAFVDHVCAETGVDAARVRDAAPTEARDATDFVNEALRSLAGDLREAVDDREREVRVDLQGAVADAREDVDRAVAAVDDVAFELSLARFAAAFDLTSPSFVENAVAVEGARNLSLAAGGEESLQPVRYALGEHSLAPPPGQQRVSVLTGANSGGKTTLLETLCQVVLLAHMGLPVPADRAEVGRFDSVVFHRRHASFNAGVLESTLRNVVPPLTEEGRTLMLVDEFEAITEPGSAADLLHGLVTLSVEKAALGTFVTHLADDLEPLPSTARVDGIFAEGLTPDLELEVDYQPRFGEVGRSTPEFIVSRLVANADDRAERSGFETLAEAVGHEVVQRTLADARWTES